VKGKEERNRDKKRGREREESKKLLSEGKCRRGINRFNAIGLRE